MGLYGKGWFVKGEKTGDVLEEGRRLALSAAHMTVYAFQFSERSPARGIRSSSRAFWIARNILARRHEAES